jgi:histidinol-phosphate aminotransferase
MSRFLRTNIRALAGYVPGEQPRDAEFIRLNTNENPYPPSPCVLEAIREAVTGERLRRYPDPLGTAFRQTAARIHSVDPDGILVGNGSDDILTIVTRAFVPEGGRVAAPTPSYILYQTLTGLQGASLETVPFTPDWQLTDPWPLPGANLTFLANPNSPSGTAVDRAAIERLAHQLSGPLVLDEAYAAFADADGMHLADRPNVIVTRSLSKSHSLAGLRFGYAVADPALVRELVKVKDTYNCDALSLAAAAAALEDTEYLQTTRARVIVTRRRLFQALVGLGFAVTPSHANFLWCRCSDQSVKMIYEELKRRRILVRYMNYDGYGDGLRISIGTDAQIDRLLEELRRLT